MISNENTLSEIPKHIQETHLEGSSGYTENITDGLCSVPNID